MHYKKIDYTLSPLNSHIIPMLPYDGHLGAISPAGVLALPHPHSSPSPFCAQVHEAYVPPLRIMHSGVRQWVRSGQHLNKERAESYSVTWLEEWLVGRILTRKKEDTTFPLPLFFCTL